jgi:hypothetical protein
MKCFLHTAAALVLLLLIAGGTAGRAQSVGPVLREHFPVGVDACFGRTYDAAHLRAHPKQRVTSFHILHDFSPDQNTEEEPQSREELIQNDTPDGDIGLTAYVRLRDRKGVYSNYFGCRRGENGVVTCGIDCDGGTFVLRPSGGALLIENQGFVVVGGCGASAEEREDPVYVRPGADDKTFRVDKQPVAQCTALRDEQKPVWAKLGTPLRQRFAKDGALCLTRSYDAAHLAAHPQQTVKRIAVLRTAGAAGHEPPQYNLIFRAELKNGRKLEARTNCWPDNYTYACTHDTNLDTVRSFYLTRAGNDVMLRDRRGNLAALFKDKLGTDDLMFRLAPAPEIACRF